MTGMKAAADAWNAGFQPTKYVSNIQIDDQTGVITVTYDTTANGIPQLLANGGGATITFTPNINKQALASGLSGSIDWGCSSSTNATATAEGLTGLVAGTVLSK